MAINVEYGASPWISALMATLVGRRQGVTEVNQQPSPIGEAFNRGFTRQLDRMQDFQDRSAYSNQRADQALALQRLRGQQDLDEIGLRNRLRSESGDGYDPSTWDRKFSESDHQRIAEINADIQDAEDQFRSGAYTQDTRDFMVGELDKRRRAIQPQYVPKRESQKEKQADVTPAQIAKWYDEAGDELQMDLKWPTDESGNPMPVSDQQRTEFVKRKIDAVRALARGEEPFIAPATPLSVAGVGNPTTQPSVHGESGGLELSGFPGGAKNSMAAQRVEYIEKALMLKAEQLKAEGRQATPEEQQIKDQLLQERRALMAKLNAG